MKRMARPFTIPVSAMLLSVIVLCLTWEFAHSADCPDRCGNVTIPYPFGIAPGCGLPGFQLNCTTNITTGKIAPFLTTLSGAFQVLKIDPQSDTILLNTTDLKAQSCDGAFVDDGFASLELNRSSPFVLSRGNLFFVNGCNSSGTVSTDLSDGVSACETDCFNDSPTYDFCNIYGCCTANLPSGSRRVSFRGGGIAYKDQEGCGYSSIIFPPSYRTKDSSVLGNGYYGLRLTWAIPGGNCSSVSPSVCSAKATCVDVETIQGYVCMCDPGYTGDGFSDGYGCADVNECLDASINSCSSHASCLNNDGSYRCLCTHGLFGDGFSNGTGCIAVASKKFEVVIVAASAAVFACVIVSLTWYVGCLVKRRRQSNTEAKNIKKAFVKTNLKHFKSMRAGSKMKSFKDLFSPSISKEYPFNCFTLQYLEKATKNFADENKLGSGGYGTVYRGNLLDGSVVAIKKTNNVNNQGAQQFLNEVAILSQVNHRNLVRLLGCCLETEVPLLVYEFIPNGTLYEHLQGERVTHLPWQKRFQIALSTAEALSYLHSAAFPPIYHRDVKSANILLDDTLTVKVADFGLSRLVPADVTHVSTAVQGTPGYLDPDYYFSYQLTDKSDVYSFGVVLLELITGQKPVDFTRPPDNVNLVSFAIPNIKSGSINRIVDPRLREAEFPEILESIAAVSQLASHCLASQKSDRPSMRRVLEEFLRIKGSTQSFRSDRKDFQDAAEKVSSCNSEEQPLVMQDGHCGHEVVRSSDNFVPPSDSTGTPASLTYEDDPITILLPR